MRLHIVLLMLNFIFILSMYVCLFMCDIYYIYIYATPPSDIYLFRGFPGHVGEHVWARMTIQDIPSSVSGLTFRAVFL